MLLTIFLQKHDCSLGEDEFHAVFLSTLTVSDVALEAYPAL